MNESKAGAAAAGAAGAPAKKKAKSGGGGGYTLEEVAKHTTKADCWVVVAGQVLDVTKFLGEHPGGELAILTFAGKDATEEFNMIHPPDVIGKYAPDAVIGALGAGKPKKEKKAKAAKAKDAPALDSSGHNIVEEYVLLSAMLHVAVALKRTWDISINYTIASGKMNLAISGVCLLTFMTIHLFQFRFGETKPYTICPPPYLVNVKGLLHLALF